MATPTAIIPYTPNPHIEFFSKVEREAVTAEKDGCGRLPLEIMMMIFKRSDATTKRRIMKASKEMQSLGEQLHAKTPVGIRAAEIIATLSKADQVMFGFGTSSSCQDFRGNSPNEGLFGGFSKLVVKQNTENWARRQARGQLLCERSHV